MTENPARGPEEYDPLICLRCGESVTTLLLQWRHAEQHADEDRAEAMPQNPKPRPVRESKFSPLVWAVVL